MGTTELKINMNLEAGLISPPSMTKMIIPTIEAIAGTPISEEKKGKVRSIITPPVRKKTRTESP